MCGDSSCLLVVLSLMIVILLLLAFGGHVLWSLCNALLVSEDSCNRRCLFLLQVISQKWMLMCPVLSRVIVSTFDATYEVNDSGWRVQWKG
jgi:hypothetical protein